MSEERLAPLELRPDALGPVVPETYIATGEHTLFAGEERFLRRRTLGRRVALIEAVSGRVKPLLDDQEAVLWVVPAVRIPSLGEQLGLGVWWAQFFKVALVLTDQRLLEVELDHRGARTLNELRSFPWSQTRELRARWSGLALRPLEGRRRHRWRLERADRKLVRKIVERLAERAMLGITAIPRPVPLYHCPECAAPIPGKRPRECPGCDLAFRSPGLATVLALALPGGGLFYTGHPLLGTLDLLGEGLLASIVATAFLTSQGTPDLVGAWGIAAFAFLLTKAESIHLARLFARRTVPEPAGSRPRWQRLAAAAAVLSATIMALPPLFAGAAAPRVDQDLVFDASELDWSGGLDASAWEYPPAEHQRSEWVSATGTVVSVYAYALGAGESFSDLRTELGRPNPDRIGQPDSFRVGWLQGVRVLERAVAEDESELRQWRYFIDDRPHRDVHLVAIAAVPGAEATAQAELEALLETARWVPVAP